MPIIDKHKLIHLHVPKTGGSSIIKFFDIWEDDSALHTFKSINFDGIQCTPQHFTGLMLQKLYPRKFEEYKKFIVVRDPYTRIISSYIDKIKHYCPYNFQIKELNQEHFHEWVETNTARNNFDHILPQVRYIGPFVVNYLIKFENLENEFYNMCATFNIPINKKLPDINKADQLTSTVELSEQILPKTITIINQYYDKDFEFFGYEKRG